MPPSRTARRTASSPVTDEQAPAAASARRLHIPIHLRWGDLDAFNHVNNASMLKLLEEVRVRAFWRPGATRTHRRPRCSTPGIDAAARSPSSHGRRSSTCVRCPTSAIRSTCSCGSESSADPASRSATRCSARRLAAEQELYARASAVVVMVDAATGRPVRLTDEQRSAWEPYLGEPVVYAHRR